MGMPVCGLHLLTQLFLMGCFIVVVMLHITGVFAWMGFAAPFFVTYPCGYGKIHNVPYDSPFFSVCVCFRIFSEMPADTPNQFVHIGLVSVFILLFIDSFIDNAVRFFFDEHGKVCQEHGYPEFLPDGVFRIAAKICEADLFFYQPVFLFNRPSEEVKRLEGCFIKVKIICDKGFKRPAWKIKNAARARTPLYRVIV